MRFELTVCLPGEAHTIGVVRRLVGESLATLGVAETDIADVRLAVSEACTNVIDHAAADDEYEVRLSLDGDQCTISVTDTGSGGVDDAELAGALPSPSSPRGRGVAIMRAVMDQVRFSSEPLAGTIVHLVKSLEPARPAGGAEDSDAGPT